MRSSVSYMLSHGTGEPIMSHPDYDQEAAHHGALLVLIRGIGSARPRALQKIFERIQQCSNVKINDLNGQVRDIWVRYVREHPVENNDWGDFQTHRRLLGLITVGSFDSQTEFNELCRVHESLKVKYNSTLYDSRSVLFGPSKIEPEPDPPPPDVISCSSAADLNSNNSSSPNLSIKKDNGEITNGVNGLNRSNSDEIEDPDKAKATIMTTKKLEELFTPPPNFKSTAYLYPENDDCPNLETNIVEFINSLFWILESKRLERTRERIDKVTLLLAPFEKKDFVGLDMESRNNKKRCMGRATKHLGDLTLQAGLMTESLALFQAASETLRAISDSLWLGAASEGLCAASAILQYPRLRAGFSEQPQLGTVVPPAEFPPPKPGHSHSPSMSSSSSISSTSSASSSSISSATNSNCTTSNTNSTSSPTLQNSLIPEKPETSGNQEYPSNMLKPEAITTHYREAIINYSKYRHAGIIETEAALKAARICIEQNKKLDVAMFLQSVLYIKLNMTEQERVQRFETLTDLYQRIGYNRKASFCQRLAAWRHVAQGNQNPDWAQSYRLMLESFSGHKLSLDPIDVLQKNSGWPCLQTDLLQQLVIAAKRLGHSALATRHMTFLLQTMWQHLSNSEQRDMCVQLQNLSAQCEGSPVPLNLENGTVIPPANLTDLPYCVMFQIKELVSHLRPHRIEAVKVDQGPFLFTPIHFNSIDRKKIKAELLDGKIDFEWIQYDRCEVTVKLLNPLPFEMQLCDMRLLTNGVVFESIPQTVTLPPLLPTYITLHGLPIEYGQLEIEGYSTHALGVKSNCKLKHMFKRQFPNSFQISVIPGLPKLKLQTSLPQTATFSGMPHSDNIVTTASVTLYNGESTECEITITNCSNIPIEYLEGSLHSSMDHSLQDRMFQWNNDEVKSKLPILPHETKQFILKIYGEADFLGPVNPSSLNTTLVPSTVDGPSSLPNINATGSSVLTASGQLSNTSFQSRVSSPNNTIRRNEMHSASFRSSNTTNTMNSGHSSLATFSLGGIVNVASPRQLEAQLRLRYSGGSGFIEGYCRQCTISVNVDLLPSAQVTNWDVLPAEVATEFYMVLDVINLTAQEMILQYTDSKNILIEARESCRVPVPVVRCPLDKIRKEIATAEVDSIFSGSEVDFTEKCCSTHISDQVNLKWSLSGTENTGVTSLKGITLSPTMIDLVTVAPLQWEVTAENVPVPPQGEISCVTGQCLTIGISICNTSTTTLQQLLLSVQFYQDYQNGVKNYRLETRIAISGPNEFLVPVLEPECKGSYEMSVIFFTPGRFKADIQCRSLSTTTITNVSDDQHALKQPALGEAHHIWRFIPSVDITVLD